MSKSVKVLEGQSMIDIAMQQYGCYEGLFLLLQDNDIALGSDLSVGQNLIIRDSVPVLTDNNLVVMQEFTRRSISVNSGLGSGLNNGYVDDGYVDEGYVD